MLLKKWIQDEHDDEWHGTQKEVDVEPGKVDCSISDEILNKFFDIRFLSWEECASTLSVQDEC